jgi:hypothetical protein
VLIQAQESYQEAGNSHHLGYILTDNMALCFITPELLSRGKYHICPQESNQAKSTAARNENLKAVDKTPWGQDPDATREMDGEQVTAHGMMYNTFQAVFNKGHSGSK